MAGQYGVKETKEALDLGIALAKLVVDAKADGKIGVEDLGLLLNLVPSVGPAVDGMSQVAKEVGELDEQDAADLLAHAAAKLAMELNDEKLAVKVAASLKVVLALGEAYAAFK